MGLDPLYVRTMKDREDTEKCVDIVRQALASPVAKLAKFGVHAPAVADDMNKAARDRAPGAWDLLVRARSGERVEPYPERATAEDNRTAKVLNLRKEFLDCFPMFTPRPVADDDRQDVSALDVARNRTQPPIVKRLDDVIPQLSRDQLVGALLASKPGTVEFIEYARALAELEA